MRRTKEEDLKIVALWLAGWSYDDVGARLTCSPATVRRLVKRHGFTAKDRKNGGKDLTVRPKSEAKRYQEILDQPPTDPIKQRRTVHDVFFDLLLRTMAREEYPGGEEKRIAQALKLSKAMAALRPDAEIDDVLTKMNDQAAELEERSSGAKLTNASNLTKKTRRGKSRRARSKE